MPRQREDPAAADRAFAAFRRSGSPRAMAAVFDRTAPELLVFARRFTRDAASAEDLVQQTFVRAIERAATFDEARPLMAWLTAILANEARQEARRRRAGERARAARGAAVAPRAPDEEVGRAELRRAMDAALAALPAAYRDVVALRLLHDVPPRGIAAALAVPVETVKTRLRRGVRKLAAHLPSGLALGVAVAGTAGHGLRAARRAVMRHAAESAGGIAALALLGGTGALLMKKTMLAAVAAVLLACLGLWAFDARTAEPVDGAPERGSTAQAEGSALATSGEGNAPARAAVGTGVPAAVADPRVHAPSHVRLRVRATWKPSGEPAADVPLVLIAQPGKRIQWARTDASGQCAFDAVIAAECWPGGAAPEHRYVSVAFALDPGRFHNVEAREDGAVVSIELDEGARVRGAVLDAAGAPVPGASIQARTRLQAEVTLGFADGAGRFDVRGLLPGTFELRACHGQSSSRAVDAEAVAAAGAEGVVLRLDEPASRLTLRVEDEAGHAIAGAFVRADGTDAGSAGPHQHVVTDARGVVVVEGMPAARYRLEIWHPAYPPALLGLDVDSGRDLAETVVLGAAAQVAGRVERPDGVAVPHADIRVFDAASLFERHAWADEDGRFALRDMPIGTYNVTAATRHEQRSPRFTLHAGTQDIRIVLRAAGEPLRGRLVGPDGEPLVRWSVVIQRSDEIQPWGRARRTDADGRFAFDELPVAHLTLEAAHPDGHGAWKFFALERGAAERVYRVPSEGMFRAGSLTARVRGAPPGTTYAVRPPHGGYIGHALPEDGPLRHDGLAPGTYHLGLSAGEGTHWLRRFEIGSGEELDLGEIDFPHRFGAVSVRVAVPPNAASDYFLQLGPAFADGERPCRVLPAGAHHWRATDLVPGDYVLLLSARDAWEDDAGFAPVLRELTVEADREIEVVLEPEVVPMVRYRLEPPPGTRAIGWWDQSVRMHAGGPILYRTRGGGPLGTHRVALADGTYWFEVETGGGYRGATAFTVPAPGGEIVFPVAPAAAGPSERTRCACARCRMPMPPAAATSKRPAATGDR